MLSIDHFVKLLISYAIKGLYTHRIEKEKN